MLGGIGLPELLVLAVIGLITSVIPIAVVVWIVVALGKIRRTQVEILDRLDEVTRERDRQYR